MDDTDKAAALFLLEGGYRPVDTPVQLLTDAEMSFVHWLVVLQNTFEGQSLCPGRAHIN